MMTKTAIRVNKLGKRYRIGLREPYKTFREVVANAATAPLRRLIEGPSNGDRYFWALKDVSFEVEEGEVVGIIGRNGAGKSTLLKILSRITAPTEGSVELHGRVGSLLEVGTGFHPELTGRENIYLSGSILGMRKREIEEKFDEIVRFSEIERFLDTPVKRYSSGMYVRLAFAVAAHLEPEILLVDEVLAVGDAAFQKKCLGKMGEVAREGRTVLFVSHNMNAIKNLCQYGIYLQNGIANGKHYVEEAISDYSKNNSNTEDTKYPIVKADVVLHGFNVTQHNLNMLEYDGGKPINVKIDFELTKDLGLFRIGFFIKSSLGELICRSLLADWNDNNEDLKRGRYAIEGELPANFLVPGTYLIQVHSSRYGIIDYGFNEMVTHMIQIKAPDNYNISHVGEKPSGVVLLNPNWTVVKK